MKKKMIVSLTGIVMSMAIAAMGCAGNAGTTGEAANSTESTVQTEVTAGEAGQTMGPADVSAGEAEQPVGTADMAAGEAEQSTGSVDVAAEESASEKHTKKKPSSDSSSLQKSAGEAVELTTVEPSVYAGQTVYGKVTAIDGSKVTVSLGTISQKNKSAGTSGESETGAPETGAPAEGSDAAPEASDGVQNMSLVITNVNVVQTTDNAANDSADPDSNIDTNPDTDAITSATQKTGEGDKPEKKKKSSFKANGEQMTITIPEGLSGVEIKEGCVLSITLDEAGNVTAIEVRSKNRRGAQGSGEGQDGNGSQDSSRRQDRNGVQRGDKTQDGGVSQKNRKKHGTEQDDPAESEQAPANEQSIETEATTTL